MDTIAEKYPNVFLTQPLVNLLDCEIPKSKFRVVAQLSPNEPLEEQGSSDGFVWRSDLLDLVSQGPQLSPEEQYQNQLKAFLEKIKSKHEALGEPQTQENVGAPSEVDPWDSDLLGGV
jgi:hypothetical protein